MESYYIKQVEPENKVYEYYTILGDHDFLDINNNPRSNTDNNKVLAKTSKLESGKQRCFLKRGDHGQIYNPIGLYSEGTANKFLTKIGRKTWEFKEVSPIVFEYYINFLRTKNTAWLRNAERELE